MPGAPFTVNEGACAGETIQFGGIVDIQADDGTILPFPWADWSFEYLVVDELGCAVAGSAAGSAAIATDPDAGFLTVTIPGGLGAGRYPHGLRGTHVPTGLTDQFFDGALTISESPFLPGIFR